MFVTQIPLTFKPIEMNLYKANLIIVSQDNLKWNYPLVGIAQSFISDQSFDFEVKCREKLNQEIVLNLDGLNENTIKNETYLISYENVIILFRSMKINKKSPRIISISKLSKIH